MSTLKYCDNLVFRLMFQEYVCIVYINFFTFVNPVLFNTAEKKGFLEKKMVEEEKQNK